MKTYILIYRIKIIKNSIIVIKKNFEIQNLIKNFYILYIDTNNKNIFNIFFIYLKNNFG